MPLSWLADLTLSCETQVSVDEFDALICPGGRAAEHLVQNPEVLALIKEFADNGKVIATQCHGPKLLCAAKIVKGRKLTGAQGVKHEIEL